MNNTWIGVGTGVLIIGILVYMGSGMNFTKPTPAPIGNTLIVSTTTDTVPEPSTPTPTEPTIPPSQLNKPLVFNLGYQKVFASGLIVTMTELSDSRCKPDVQCIWAGEISASFTIVGGGINPSQTIQLGSATKKSAVVGDYLITLISADEISATITVTKTTDVATTTNAN